MTVSALVMGGNLEQLEPHLRLAQDNGLTQEEVKEALVHLAFYAGWPKALSAISVAQRVFGQ